VACSGNERRGGWPPPQPGSAGRCFGGTVKRTGIGQEYGDFGGVSVKLQYLVPFLSRNFNGAMTFLLYRTVHVKGGDTVRPVSMGFHECFMHIEYNATSAKFYFLHETLRREKERVSPW
jgi:hypothetical protein